MSVDDLNKEIMGKKKSVKVSQFAQSSRTLQTS